MPAQGVFTLLCLDQFPNRKSPRPFGDGRIGCGQISLRDVEGQSRVALSLILGVEQTLGLAFVFVAQAVLDTCQPVFAEVNAAAAAKQSETLFHSLIHLSRINETIKSRFRL